MGTSLVLLAWSWSGHHEITAGAIAVTINLLAQRGLLGRLRTTATQLKSKLWNLSFDVCAQDISWTSLVGKLFYIEVPHSRIPHFTRDSWEPAFTAYTASVAYIKQTSLDSMRSIHAAFKTPANKLEGVLDSVVVDRYEWQRGEWGLGRALHALQDSYALGHVDRTSSEVIRDIHTWDRENRTPNPKTGWPGHEALDNAYKDAAGRWTVQGQMAVNASVDLMMCVLGEANGPAPETAFPGMISQCLEPHLQQMLTQVKRIAA